MNSGECHQPKFQLVSKLTDLVMAFFLNLPQALTTQRVLRYDAMFISNCARTSRRCYNFM